MNRFLTLLFSASTVFFLLSETASGETFTNAAGVTIEGEIQTADLEAGTVTIHITKHRKDYPLELSALSEESRVKVAAWYREKFPSAAEWVKPGVLHNLEFAELGNCNHDDSPLNANVYIPTGYEPEKPVPMVVWLTGGKGGNAIGAPKNIAGTESFVCVSLPYPSYEGRDIFDRQEDGGMVEFWEAHRTMLDAIAKAIPNLDPNIRVIAGFSNGAHSIAGYLDQVEDEFAEYFNVFVFGDGGVRGGDWSSQRFKGDHAYCCWGETSNNKDLTEQTADSCEGARMETTRSEMAQTGHKFTPEEMAKVQVWLLETVVPARSAGQSSD